MIVPMNKFSFLVFHQDYQNFLDNVRGLGVVHLIEKQEEVSDEVRDQYDLIRQIQSVVKSLIKRVAEPSTNAGEVDGEKAFLEVRDLYQKMEEKYQQLIVLQKEISHIRPWGDFSRKTLQKLSEKDLHVKFYTISTSRFNTQWPEEFPMEVIGQHSGQTYFVLIHKGDEEFAIDADEMRQPERPLSELLHYEKELKKDLEDTDALLSSHAANSMNAIKRYGYQIKESIDLKTAFANTEKQVDDKVMLLEGWVPEEKKDELIEYLENNKLLYLVQKSKVEDKAPILLKNKKFAKRFEMLGDLYSLPKYSELDLTPFFAPFYTLFFGFCLGDAGYGILMAIAALVMKKKVKKEMKQVMGLIFYLGLSTFLFGVISGVFFGIPLFETGLPVYSDLAARFARQGTDINMLLFYLALVLGAIQIMFGMILKAINETRQYGWKHAVGTMGWILLITGGIGLYAVSEIFGIAMEKMNPAFYLLLGVSGVMILLLNNMTRNVFMNLGIGLWNTYNMVTGILGDLLSYIRLFALGISSAILGFVFNSLAVEMSGNIPVVSILVMVVILVVGHGINLFMSGLGAFVHPMRLTFVEFYKNAGFAGGGKQYKPFKKIT